MTSIIRQRSSIGSLSAVVAGEGPCVVLIHGVGLQAQAWDAQIAALAADYRVIAVDMPGHGRSATLGITPTLAEFTDAIAEVMQEPCVVIGHSFGAMIALRLAVSYPHKVRAIVALNAIFQRSEVAKAAVTARADSLDSVSIADPTVTLERWFGSAPSPQRDACRQWLCEVDPVGYRDAYRVFAAQDGPPEQDLQNLHCPALFLTGAEEPNSTPEMSMRMAQMAPQGRCEILPNSAHMLPMTHAVQLNGALFQFLKEAAA